MYTTLVIGTKAFAKKFNQELDEENKRIIQRIKAKEAASKNTNEDREELIDYAIQRFVGNQYPKGSMLEKIEREQIGKMVDEAISEYKQDLSRTDAGVNESSGKGANEGTDENRNESLLSSHPTTHYYPNYTYYSLSEG